MPYEDLLREYDRAVAARFHPATVVVNGQPVLQVAVPGLAAPVPLGIAMPEEWFRGFGMPFISITPEPPMLAPARLLPSWEVRGPGGPHAIELLKTAPVAMNFPYAIELVASTRAEFNALTLYLLTVALPEMGYGTTVEVFGQSYGFRGTASHDKTDYATTQGRIFRARYEYVVEGWMFSTETLLVPRVLDIQSTFLGYTPGENLQSDPPPPVTRANLVEPFDLAQPDGTGGAWLDRWNANWGPSWG